MSVIQSCHDTKDTLDLFRPQGLYLKPVARLNVSVQLPALKKSGAKISNWEVMERVKEMAKPLTFPVFKVAKSSLEFIRFEAEIENYGSMDSALAKLDMKTIKLSGFEELLKVRAAEAKPPFPTRHDWDTFFRENRNMNEMKAGERPDTIHIENLPTKWFVNHQDKSGVTKDKPSEYVLKKVFQCFGEIRAVDIPTLDPYREKMKKSISGIQTFSFGQDMVFEAYIQFKEYIGFVKAMNSMKGMKLLYKDNFEERSWVANIKVDFDKTKHLAESTIKKRAEEREKLVEKEREKEESEKRRKDIERMKHEQEMRKFEEDEREQNRLKEAIRQEKMTRRMQREERRRMRKMQKRSLTEEEEMNERIEIEERKLLVAQRKLESIRMLDELLERVKVIVKSKKGGHVKSLEADLFKAAEKASKYKVKATDFTSLICKDKDEKLLRDKLVNKLKQKEIEKMEHCGEKLRHVKERNLYDFSDNSFGSMEEISDDDLDDGSRNGNGDKFDDVSDDDLRLTSTDEEGEVGREQGKPLKVEKSKKKKKEKKKKKKKHKDDEKKKEKKKKRELESHITLAQRIADKERRSRSRETQRERHVDDGYPDYRSQFKHRRDRDNREGQREDGFPDYRSRIREKRLQERMEAKKAEQTKEEVYDKMMNPHLYGVGGGGYRRLKKGEHYEDVQNQLLENEIRIRERRERYKGRERDISMHHHDRDRSHGRYDDFHRLPRGRGRR